MRQVVFNIFRNTPHKFISLFTALLCFSCAPSISEFQSADLVGKGRIEAVPYLVGAEAKEEGQSMELQDSKGIRIAYGVNNNFDLHFKYESMVGNGDYIKGSAISLGFKGRLYTTPQHRISFCMPFSYYQQNTSSGGIGSIFGDSSMDITPPAQTHITIDPTLLASSRVLNNIDINYSGKMIKRIGGDEIDADMETGYAFNVSASIPIAKFKLIPEYGLLKIDDQKYVYKGVGVSFKF